ncbi:galectin-1-like protein [Camelus ferus]|nr:galectin-1-like protein [Camelus ferus]
MACGLVTSTLNLKPGECLTVQGEVAPDAKSFVLNMGKDCSKLCLPFNPRFHTHGDTHTIVCNSKASGAWGGRAVGSLFSPSSLQVSWSVHLLPPGRSNHQAARWVRIQAPQWPEATNYLAANGNFKIKCLAFE